MKAIQKYSPNVVTKDGRTESISVSPNVGINFNVYPDGMIYKCSVEKLVGGLNNAYTQAILDLINGDIKLESIMPQNLILSGSKGFTRKH